MKRIGPPIVGVFMVILAVILAGCTELEYFAANVPTHFGAYKRVTDLSYGNDRRQKLDVYSPKIGSDHPVVVFWYGGSWQHGNKGQYRFVAAALAERGFVTVLPDYRLYPAVKFPDFVKDGASAVAWVETRARDYGGDPGRIVLMGHSAGAHMAALLALDSVYLEEAGAKPESIVGLVGLSGPYALDPNTDALKTIFSSPWSPSDWQPVHFVSDRSPPALLLHGADDTVVSPHHTEALRDALQSHKVAVQVSFYPERGHADTVAPFSVLARNRTPAFEEVITFLNKVTQKGR